LPQLLLKIDEIDGDEAAKAARKALVGCVNSSIDRSGPRGPRPVALGGAGGRVPAGVRMGGERVVGLWDGAGRGEERVLVLVLALGLPAAGNLGLEEWRRGASMRMMEIDGGWLVGAPAGAEAGPVV
jgi:hypothetical protein